VTGRPAAARSRVGITQCSCIHAWDTARQYLYGHYHPFPQPTTEPCRNRCKILRLGEAPDYHAENWSARRGDLRSSRSCPESAHCRRELPPLSDRMLTAFGRGLSARRDRRRPARRRARAAALPCASGPQENHRRRGVGPHPPACFVGPGWCAADWKIMVNDAAASSTRRRERLEPERRETLRGSVHESPASRRWRPGHARNLPPQANLRQPRRLFRSPVAARRRNPTSIGEPEKSRTRRSKTRG